MHKEKRATARRPMRFTAWVAVEGQPLHGCALSDISQSGAKLDVENSETVPDRFILLLSRRGRPRRTCRVIWRTPTQLGVEFERASYAPAPVKIVERPAEPPVDAAGKPDKVAIDA